MPALFQRIEAQPSGEITEYTEYCSISNWSPTASANAPPDPPSPMMVNLEPFADRLDLGLIGRSYQFSAQAHRGQKRWSGEDAVTHGVAVARILVEQHLDSVSIACGLLHDVVEDTESGIADIEREFGAEVAGIVDGLTKLSSLQFRSAAEEQVENYRKLLVSIARDAGVIIIKLADRLHNMRTLEHLPEDKQARIALETREIYAPLAHRFGMGQARAQWLNQDEIAKFYADFEDRCDFIGLENFHGWSTPELGDFTMGYQSDTYDGDPLTDKLVCPWTIFSITVNWNGATCVCPEDWAWKTIVGSAETESIYDLWNGEAMFQFRKMHLEGRRNENIACRGAISCARYRIMLTNTGLPYSTATSSARPLELALNLLLKVFRSNNKLLLCGNGGSAADCDHIVAELMKGMDIDRTVVTWNGLPFWSTKYRPFALTASRRLLTKCADGSSGIAAAT